MSVIRLNRKSPKFSSYLDSQRVVEISRLEDEIAKSFTEINILSVELKQLEYEIGKFIDEYYQSVGFLFKNDAKEIRTDKAKVSIKVSSVNKSKSVNLNDTLSKLYKKLAKMCHPDAQHEATDGNLIVNVNKAYESKNLEELIKIEQYLIGEGQYQDESPQSKLLRLSQSYDELLVRLKTLKERKNELMQSPEYELRRQVIWAKMCGEDLIAEIKRNITQRMQMA
jgi:molecular chaperone DnaK (HSP70)